MNAKPNQLCEIVGLSDSPPQCFEREIIGRFVVTGSIVYTGPGHDVSGLPCWTIEPQLVCTCRDCGVCGYVHAVLDSCLRPISDPDISLEEKHEHETAEPRSTEHAAIY